MTRAQIEAYMTESDPKTPEYIVAILDEIPREVLTSYMVERGTPVSDLWIRNYDRDNPDFGFEVTLKNARTYVQVNPGGGNLHTALEDANLEDRHLGWCSGWCSAEGDVRGQRIADNMLGMPMDDRYELVSRLYLEP